MFYTKYFAKEKWQQFPTNFFITKFITISYKKKIKTKLVGNISFFSSDRLRVSPTMLLKPNNNQDHAPQSS